MGLNDHIQGLVGYIQSTPEFSKLKEAKSSLHRNTGLTKELDAFNEGQKQLYSGKMGEKESEAKIRQMNAAFDKLSKIPEVDRYLRALNDFNRMLTGIYDRINAGFEKGL